MKYEDTTICKCIHRLKVEINSLVEVVIYSLKDKIAHPFHLHGNKFQVVDSGILKDTNNLTEANVKLNLKNKKFPYKDTAAVPFAGYTRIRFRAINPGFWLLHCHYDWHLSIGE